MSNITGNSRNGFFSPSRSKTIREVPSKRGSVRCVAADDTSPNTKALILRHKKQNGKPLLVQTFNNNVLHEEEAVEFDIKAVMTEKLELLTNTQLHTIHELRMKVANLTVENHTNAEEITVQKRDLDVKNGRIAKLEHMKEKLEKLKLKYVMKDKNKKYQLAQEVKARLKLESRVGIMEWVLNMELTDKLRELKELLHQMPQVAENEVARLEMLGRIQMMEHAIFFGLTESMETTAEI